MEQETVLCYSEPFGWRVEDESPVGGGPSGRKLKRRQPMKTTNSFESGKCGMSDIARQYVRKHGKPEVGKRVCVRTQQQMDGGQDEFQETEAVFVPRGPGAARQKRFNSYGTPTEHLRKSYGNPTDQHATLHTPSGEDRRQKAKAVA